jgi:hypothetical protein
MVYEVLHSVLVNGVRLAIAFLPAAPLLGLKRPAASAVRNIVLVHSAFADRHGAESDDLSGRRGGLH